MKGSGLNGSGSINSSNYSQTNTDHLTDKSSCSSSSASFRSTLLALTPTSSSRHSHSSQRRTESRGGLDRAKEKELSAASQCTAEDLFAAMLGRKDLTKSVSEDGSVLYREEFCGACGVLHSRPELLHIYTRCSCVRPSTRSVLSLSHTHNLFCSCKSCYYVLREPIKLRKLYEGTTAPVGSSHLT